MPLVLKLSASFTALLVLSISLGIEVDAWISNGPVAAALAARTSAKIRNVHWTQDANTRLVFVAQGAGISVTRVELFDLNGVLISQSTSQGTRIALHVAAQRLIPNGVYLYRVRVLDQSGAQIHCEVRKLILLR